jgi:cobalt-zinc-cadmium efflux system membrane fusion protein
MSKENDTSKTDAHTVRESSHQESQDATTTSSIPGERTAYEVAAKRRALTRNLIIVGAVVLVALVAIFFIWTRSRPNPDTRTDNSTTPSHEEGAEVKLSPEAMATAGVEIEGVTQGPAVATLRVTGTVETNQEQTQQVSALVVGRVDQVNVVLGDRVRAGSVLALISSPQIAQMHGKLHEAETTLGLAERNFQRVQKTENRVAVLQAKARLDETEATLKRTRRLIELGAGAGKDLIAAEAAHKNAKAEYEFQTNISLNREMQEAAASVETARVDLAHIRDEMRALGAPIPEGTRHDHNRDTSLVAVRAPVSGTVIERLVNAGAGIEAGQSLFTIANLATVWVIANVSESQVGLLRPGMRVEISSAALGTAAIAGRVNYIDPKLNEETRTARVRVEVANANEVLKAGMFVEVGLETTNAGVELMVHSEAVQRIGDRSVVFIPKDNEPGAFAVREVEVGGEREGYHRVLNGLRLGEKVVTKGSFTLKTQMMKGEMGEAH